MTRNLYILLMTASLVLPLAAYVGAVGERVGGDADILYETINAGGASFATNGAIKLGGSLGQNGFMWVSRNAHPTNELVSGFWKADDSCTLYEPSIIDVAGSNGAVGITFMVVNSNTYYVMYQTEEHGGLLAGAHAFTNLVSQFMGEGLAGSSTTVWDNVSNTNLARFYLIRCEP
ncbi:MAG: hypothetical protein JXB04_13365 [Kiritimatiellae bacterium]|nr:hypothetical protein [Kiritimatiellia bacterium]